MRNHYQKPTDRPSLPPSGERHHHTKTFHKYILHAYVNPPSSSLHFVFYTKLLRLTKMGFCDSSMVVSDHFVLCKAALIFGVTRWVLSWAQKLVKHYIYIFSWSLESSQEATISTQSSSTIQPCSSSLLAMVKDHLNLTTFEEVARRRLPLDDRESHDMSCAVCLKRFKKKNQVWELSNCSHVFHEVCLSRWLIYDARLSCPLCRNSLITMSSESSSSCYFATMPQQPSWAVERILYLFGDDLLCSSSYSSSLVEDHGCSSLPCYS